MQWTVHHICLSFLVVIGLHPSVDQSKTSKQALDTVERERVHESNSHVIWNMDVIWNNFIRILENLKRRDIKEQIWHRMRLRSASVRSLTVELQILLRNCALWHHTVMWEAQQSIFNSFQFRRKTCFLRSSWLLASTWDDAFYCALYCNALVLIWVKGPS